MKKILQQFEEILNKQILNGKRKYFGQDIFSINIHGRYIHIRLEISKNTIEILSHNDLLFGRYGFLESLIWKFDGSHYVKNPRDDRGCIVGDYSCNSSETDYHKMQLVLLSSDEERILYIINNIA